MAKQPDRPGRLRDPFRLREVLAEPQILTLIVVMGVLVALIHFFSFQIVPFAMALVIAYFLDAGVKKLTDRGLRRGLAVGVIFCLYLVVYGLIVVGPIPLTLNRAHVLALRLPEAKGQLEALLRDLPDFTFGLLPPERKAGLIDALLDQMRGAAEFLLTGTWSWLPQATTWVIYLFLVPLLVFFFLKDKHALLEGCVRCLPKNRQLVTRIWLDMEVKMGNYVRGKIWEILLVAAVTWLVFALLGFEYPALLGIVSGISVLIPYVGAIAVAVPTAVLGYLQWGLTWDLGWLLIAYTAIQLIDGNLVAPLIFSEAVKLHPVVIVFAVILFGSVWGIWGVFFAIPLATLMSGLMSTVLDFRDGVNAQSTPPPPAGGPAGQP